MFVFVSYFVILLDIPNRNMFVFVSYFVLLLKFVVVIIRIISSVVSSNPAHGEVYSIQHNVIQFVIALRNVGSFRWILQFPPSIKLTVTI
jgi:hypothetical protein